MGVTLALLGAGFLWTADSAPVLPGDETDPSAAVRAAAGAAKAPDGYETPAHLRFPYVSTYYVKPIVKVGEIVEIGYFTTDWDSSKIRFLDDKFRFDVHLEYAAEGAPWKTLTNENVKSGDGKFLLGALPLGDYTLRIWSVDRGSGLASHRVIHEFKVVPVDYFDTSTATYVMTEDDLTKYGVSNQGATKQPVKVDEPGWADLEAMGERNVAGLQKLIDEKAAAGIRKLVLLKGTYRVTAKGKIELPDNFTLDLNGATLKENGFTGCNSVIVEFPSAKNAHLVNGTLEGDYYEHDYEHSDKNSEWPLGFCLTGDSRYCSVRNVVVKDITGYGGSNGIGHDRRGGLAFFAQGVSGNWSAGSLDAKGDVQPDAARFTSDFQDFRPRAGDSKYLQISKYLGYQGRATRSWWMTVCWYDSARKFISSETAFQYRQMLIPKNAAFLRVSVEIASAEDAKKAGLYVCLFRVPWNCSIVKCTFDNCRCVGYAASAMKNHLFLGNEFTRSGQKAARCAFDAEDGWDQMQDVFFFENWFHDNPVNNSILTCAGHNFVMERNRCSIHLWGRTYSPCVRNNDIGHGTYKCDSRMRSGYGRFENNRYTVGATIGDGKACGWDYVLSGLELGAADGEFKLKTGESGRLVGCTIRGKGVQLGNLYRCTVENCEMTFLPDATWNEVTVRDSSLRYIYGTNRYNRCVFENVTMQGLKGGRKLFDRCVFRKVRETGLESANIAFRGCQFTDTIFSGSYWEHPAFLAVGSSTIETSAEGALFRPPLYNVKNIVFDNCKVSGPKALVDLWDLRPQPTDGEPAAITVKNCTFDKGFGAAIAVSGHKGSASPKKLTITATGNKPKTASVIASGDVLPTWTLAQ